MQEAINQWRACACDPTYPPALQRSCERTAQALEIQRDTGVAVCSCCRAPLASGKCANPVGGK